MNVENFLSVLNAGFFAGVPDSLLRALCDALIDKYGVNTKQHIIAANEGNAVALAAGYHLATGKIPAVYLQNSGEGNIINPVASLLSREIYGIPVVFVIGWRGEPGVKDEPQHIFQGKATLKLLEDMDIDYFVIGDNTTVEELSAAYAKFTPKLNEGGQVAFVVRKGAFTYDKKAVYDKTGSLVEMPMYEGFSSANKNLELRHVKNEFQILREDAIRRIVNAAKDDIIVATTGKIGRELYEIREQRGEGHERDFLTVGSMGHASSIALGIALNAPERKIWCIDGDGAAIMHMGAMATIGMMKPKNLIHVVINNASHESVGGMPTAQPNFCAVAEACGYENIVKITAEAVMNEILLDCVKENKSLFIEICCSLMSRKDLGRPKESPLTNKAMLMKKFCCKGR